MKPWIGEEQRGLERNSVPGGSEIAVMDTRGQ